MKYLQFSWYSLHIYKCAELLFWWKSLPNSSLDRKKCPCLIGFSFSHPGSQDGEHQGRNVAEVGRDGGSLTAVGSLREEGLSSPGSFKWLFLFPFKTDTLLSSWRKGFLFPSSIVLYWRWQSLDLASQQKSFSRVRRLKLADKRQENKRHPSNILPNALSGKNQPNLVSPWLSPLKLNHFLEDKNNKRSPTSVLLKETLWTGDQSLSFGVP